MSVKSKKLHLKKGDVIEQGITDNEQKRVTTLKGIRTSRK